MKIEMACLGVHGFIPQLRSAAKKVGSVTSVRSASKVSIASSGSRSHLSCHLRRPDLILDLALEPLEAQARHQLIEIVEERYGCRSTLITGELLLNQGQARSQ